MVTACSAEKSSINQPSVAELDANPIAANIDVVIVTNQGDISLSLNAEQAPISVANFLSYVDSGFYQQTIFHRVIDNFMIQGGGFDPAMKKKTTQAAINNEADNGLFNATGTIAMARTNAPHSATSQFFINVNDNAFLNHRGKNAAGWGYAVFGQVTAGMDVINAIKSVPTGRLNGMGDVPNKPIIIERISRISNAE
ncbi:MAG: peptidylprolyl isomerase [Pseudomonadales bacterium]|nr:peptidylprolyl isomerase [Pseudomonadales bacterium]